MTSFRFPGLRSFEETEANLFKGREREKRALFDLIAVERSVVLFAKSGAGKTSLLKAGIVPMFAGLPYQPVFIRLNRDAQPVLQQTMAQIAQVFGVSPVPGQSLWEYLKAVNSNIGNTTPVLFFDQFEEVFTLYSNPEGRQEFITQVADIINGTVPSTLEKILLTLHAGDPALVYLEKPPRVKIIFSIRSDMLSYMHELSDFIPGILRNRFELKGLSIKGATDAMVLPAALPDDHFECPPFQITQDALQNILKKLTERKEQYHETPEIESFQLQLICNELEKKMIQQHRQNIHPLTVDINTYGGTQGIDDLLFRFYKDTLEGITDKTQQQIARIAIEDTLVQNERRLSVAESTLTAISLSQKDAPKKERLLPNTLTHLVDKRLLRKEERPGMGNYYELIHDTLLGPVLRYKNERKAREAAQNALAAFQQKMRRWGIALSIVTLCMLATLAFLWYVNLLRNQTLYNFLVLKSEVQAQQDNTLAFRLAEAAWAIFPDSADAQGGMLSTFYGNLFLAGDSLYATPHYYDVDAISAQPGSKSDLVLLVLPDRHTVSVLNLSTARQKEYRLNNASLIGDVFLSPDGQRVLTIHPQDSIAYVWSLEEGRLLYQLVHTKPVNTAAFSADGAYITTNASDELQRLWTSDGRLVRQYANLATSNASTTFSPDGKILLIGKDNQTIELYTPGAQAPFATLKTDGDVDQVMFDGSGQFLLVKSVDWEGNADVQIRVFNIRGMRTFEKTFSATTQVVRLENNGSEMTVVSNDTLQKIRLADSHINTLQVLNSNTLAVAASPDHRLMALSARDKTLQLIGTNAPGITLAHTSRPLGFFFSTDSKFLVVPGSGKKVRVWSLKSNPVARLATISPPAHAFFKPGTYEMMVQDFSGKTYCEGLDGKPCSSPEWLKKGSIAALDGQSVLAPAEQGWKRIAPGSGITIDIPLPDVDPNNNDQVRATAGIAAMLRNGRVIIYSEKQKKTSQIELAPHRRADKMALSVNGMYLAIQTIDTTATEQATRLEWWNVEQAKMLDTTSCEERINDLVFSPQSERLFIAGRAQIFEWRLKKEPLLLLSNEQIQGRGVISLAVSPNGHFLAIGGSDGKILICDHTGRPIHTLNPQLGTVHGLQFSNDGHYLLSRHFKNAVLAWPFAPDVLLQKLDAQQARKLTEQEKRIYKVE